MTLIAYRLQRYVFPVETGIQDRRISSWLEYSEDQAFAPWKPVRAQHDS